MVREEAVLADQLRSAGEIGSHSADHRPVGGWPLSKQLASLSRTFADISAWSGEAPLGFRPPREEFDSATLEAWRRVGGLYVAATNSARSAAPELIRV
ncbi:MAG: polysaccharide deacetylase family protein, partial [Gemmatimonadota bacterium]